MNYVIIRAYDNYIYANMQLGMLRDDGIDCHLKDEMFVTIDPMLSPMVGGMKLMVAEDEVPRALKVLEEAETAWLQTVPCPVCGNKTLEKVIQQTFFPNAWGRIKSMIINGDATETKKFYHCRHCNYDFDDIKERDF